jgi:hypothetical protein
MAFFWRRLLRLETEFYPSLSSPELLFISDLAALRSLRTLELRLVLFPLLFFFFCEAPFLFFSWPLSVFFEFLELMLFFSSANSLCKALHFASAILLSSRCMQSRSCFWVACTSASKTIAASAVAFALCNYFAFFPKSKEFVVSRLFGI